MKILIIGTGNVATAMAADLTLKGHQIVMLKTTNKVGIEHYKEIKNKGIIYKDKGKNNIVKIENITDDYDEAFNFEPNVIIVAVQTNYHEEIVKNIAKYIKSKHIVMFTPGYMSTAYILKYCKNNIPIVVEAESSVIDCRVTKPGELTTLFKNVRNPIGVFPKSEAKETLEKLKSWKYNYILTESVIEAALHNPNLIVHTIGAIMSIPRIEYTNGEYWMYKEVFTPSIWNLVEKLDNEKMQVLKKLNLDVLPYVEACKIRNSIDLSINAKEVFFDYANNSSPKGPNTSDSRYITEDVPQGLVLLESLGNVLNINTPVCSALIEIAGNCLNTDFRKEGRTVKRLGKEYIDKILEDK